jgi:hypothetical protein
MTILFLHGWQSIPFGVKPTYLKEHGHDVLDPKLPDDDFSGAVRIAQAEFNKHWPQVVVGSSRGGAVAMNIECGGAKLVLLCPAWKKYGMARTVKPGTVILHSRSDEVIPFADSEELVRNSGLPAPSLIEVGNDHRLADPEPLEAMLRACHTSRAEKRIPEKERSMTIIGNHMKFNVHKSLRERVRSFFVDVLQCTTISSPVPDLELYLFSDSFVLGVFFCDQSDVLSAEDHLKAAWLEIKTADVHEFKRRLIEFGVKEVEYSDKSRFYFQAPGGQVFRLAPEEGGI